jgi:hypothetical protein
MPKTPDHLAETRRIMAALGRMPPKPHDEMKIGRKPKPKKPKSPEVKGRKPDSAA